MKMMMEDNGWYFISHFSIISLSVQHYSVLYTYYSEDVFSSVMSSVLQDINHYFVSENSSKILVVARKLDHM